ncbi:MAG: trypsin-like peptidase domain-containing protein [Gemmatimonadota bacterium]
MTLELKVLSGSRAGHELRFDTEEVSVGRHATSDVRFDPQKDLDVSTRHAELRKNADGWIVTDLGSTNGTLVNGERVTGECRIYDGDIITFGANGPRVEVRGVGASRKSPPAGSAAAPGAKRIDTGVRVAIEVKKQTKTLRNTFAVVIGLLVIAGAAAFAWTQKQSAAREAEYAALIARGDSTTAALQKALASIPATDTALMNRLKQEIAEKEGEIQRAKAMIAGGTMTAGSVEALSQRMRQSPAALQMDFSKVSTLNDAAVAMVVSDLDGVPTAGTAFCISASGLLVTNKHVVRTEAGQPARRIAVLFANKQGWTPAKIVRVSDTDDLALIQIDGTTPRPVVSGVSREGQLAKVGAPVASIGYPLANDTPMGGSSLTDLVARTTITPGTVSKRLDDVIQMDSFAGHGSSGSPLFDASGTVVGVIYGGAKESGGRIVYAVPAQRLAAFLGPDGNSVLR